MKWQQSNDESKVTGGEPRTNKLVKKGAKNSSSSSSSSKLNTSAFPFYKQCLKCCCLGCQTIKIWQRWLSVPTGIKENERKRKQRDICTKTQQHFVVPQHKVVPSRSLALIPIPGLQPLGAKDGW
ncbi:hypothetical protein TRVL_02071 [Trypanosoma vivax]|uniref:Uncharacterized protein n=1 Tax=Trypanosoma vivax (strain Y486) TaxID=1055687 RepID=G0U882_TRYVY|nr:hypothetical protein TRVL_02071 [Trypanosoma vivax]CCC52092.1 hypothetical protein, unlikely [Trypanosoma vivax Y486]